jgi:hypothetical protein
MLRACNLHLIFQNLHRNHSHFGPRHRGMSLAVEPANRNHMIKEMKVLIQHPKSLKYWSVMNRWTDQLAEAVDFKFALNAVRHGIDLGKPFLIAFKFEQPAMHFTSHAFAGGGSSQTVSGAQEAGLAG